ncbi:hypothetical protein [Sutterella sp.]|uniref:hypothetical protein n=1 Tax=Sutterella sp. TaxID=1981025 RepID=UPI0026E0A213|nr:hypothetical protein [Sutterella sp.]MDO5532757.1 hypothetical protein [Sutterella sp.]
MTKTETITRSELLARARETGGHRRAVSLESLERLAKERVRVEHKVTSRATRLAMGVAAAG